jgi:hypothetical protein
LEEEHSPSSGLPSLRAERIADQACETGHQAEHLAVPDRAEDLGQRPWAAHRLATAAWDASGGVLQAAMWGVPRRVRRPVVDAEKLVDPELGALALDEEELDVAEPPQRSM